MIVVWCVALAAAQLVQITGQDISRCGEELEVAIRGQTDLCHLAPSFNKCIIKETGLYKLRYTAGFHQALDQMKEGLGNAIKAHNLSSCSLDFMPLVDEVISETGWGVNTTSGTIDYNEATTSQDCLKTLSAQSPDGSSCGSVNLAAKCVIRVERLYLDKDGSSVEDKEELLKQIQLRIDNMGLVCQINFRQLVEEVRMEQGTKGGAMTLSGWVPTIPLLVVSVIANFFAPWSHRLSL